LTDQQNVTCTSISAVAINPSNRQHLLAGCGSVSSGTATFSELNGVMQSFDAGATWTMLTGFPLNLSISSIVINSNISLVSVRRENSVATGIRASSTQRGIWRSIDAGVTWSKVALPGISVSSTSSKSALFRLAQDPRQPEFVVAASPMGIHLSADAGMTWSLSTNGLNVSASSVISLASNAVLGVASSGSGNSLLRVIWVGFTSCSSSCSYEIYRSIDNGAQWAVMSEPGSWERSGFYGLGDYGSFMLIK
jgi:hypothetical protein